MTRDTSSNESPPFFRFFEQNPFFSNSDEWGMYDSESLRLFRAVRTPYWDLVARHIIASKDRRHQLESRRRPRRQCCLIRVIRTRTV